MSRLGIAGGLLSSLAVAMGGASASADTLVCAMITSIPYTITQAGSYCLDRDLTMSSEDPGAAITIAASQVVLDLNSFTLANYPVHPRLTATNGIYALNRQHITVRNGTVRGFLRGVYLQGSFNGFNEEHLVEGIGADDNNYEGIAVEGSGTVVRNNRVLALPGSSLSGLGEGRGIRVMGVAAQVLDNQVFEVHGEPGTSRAYGIYVNSSYATVQGNRVANARELTELTIAIGIVAPNVLVLDNRMSLFDQGLSFESGGSGKYRDNVTVSVATPYTGGTNLGNNH